MHWPFSSSFTYNFLHFHRKSTVKNKSPNSEPDIIIGGFRRFSAVGAGSVCSLLLPEPIQGPTKPPMQKSVPNPSSNAPCAYVELLPSLPHSPSVPAPPWPRLPWPPPPRPSPPPSPGPAGGSASARTQTCAVSPARRPWIWGQLENNEGKVA